MQQDKLANGKPRFKANGKLTIGALREDADGKVAKAVKLLAEAKKVLETASVNLQKYESQMTEEDKLDETMQHGLEKKRNIKDTAEKDVDLAEAKLIKANAARAAIDPKPKGKGKRKLADNSALPEPPSKKDKVSQHAGGCT